MLLLLGTLGGIILFAIGFRLHRRARLIESTPTSTVRSLAMGLVEIIGRAEAAGPLLTSPFGDMPCVFYFYKAEEQRRTGKSTKWVTVAKGQSHQPFLLRDDTGEVMVVPVGAHLMIEPRARFQSGPGCALSPTAASGLASLGITTSGWLSEKPMRCTEGFILPDEEVYVLGSAQENSSAIGRSDNASRLFIGHGPDGEFIISDQSESALLSALRWKSAAALFGGPALTAACVWAVLSWYVSVGR